MFKLVSFFILVGFTTTVFAQVGEDRTFDLSISEVSVNGGDHYPLQGQEISIYCQQNLLPKTNIVDWNSIVGYFFSQHSVFDSTAILLATDQSSLGGRTQDEFDPEEAIIGLPDSVRGVAYIYVIADYLGTFSHLESNLDNNVVKIPIIIQKIPRGIEDKKEEFITLYPNPVSSVLNVKVPAEKCGEIFEILDISGNVVKKVPSGNCSTQIDVSNLSAGIYFLYTSGFERLQKFLIN